MRAEQLTAAVDWPPGLGAGEQAAIRLAQQLGCQVLMDDKLARRAAASAGLSVIGDELDFGIRPS
jgi:predicted nucleic acid-binding protein